MADDPNDYFARYAQATTGASAPDDPNDYFAKYKNQTDEPGLGSSFARGVVEGGTFGYEKKLGFDEEAREESKRVNPWTHFAGEVAGSLIPMAAATLLPTGVTQAGAAARGASLLNRAGQLARRALVPAGEIRNVGQSMGQGVKLGTVYGGLSGSGHADVKDEDTLGEALGKRALGTVKGAAFGAPTGAALGAAGHGLSRLVGAAVNLRYPELKQVMESAGSWELQGIRDVVRNAGYDKYVMADFEALKRNLADPAQAHLYQGLNLIEALEMTRVKPIAGPGSELMQPKKVSQNLGWMAQENANTGGVGAQEAAEAFATRKQVMGNAIQADIDATFGKEQNLAGNLIQSLTPGSARNVPGRAADAEALPGLVDTHFGSGNRAGREAALGQIEEGVTKRYDKMKRQPLQNLSEDRELTRVAQNPVFQKAMNEASQNDMLRLAMQGADVNPEVGLPWMASGWAPGQIGQTINTLSARNILDIHHHLVEAAKVPFGQSSTAESRYAQKLKVWFSDWVDRQFAPHNALRTDYAVFKSMLEAQEYAGNMGLVGNQGGKSLAYLEKIAGEASAADQAIQTATNAYNQAAARVQAGRIQPRSIERYATNLRNAAEEQYRRQQPLESFRAEWGEALKTRLASATNDLAASEKLIAEIMTPEGQRRILLGLGEQQGRQFLGNVLPLYARNMGSKLGLTTGGQDAQALAFFNRMRDAGNLDAMTAFKQAWGDAIKQQLQSAGDKGPLQVVNGLLTPEGKQRLLNILGPDDGRTFIESLYNKKAQLGLSQRLYGNSDTTFKFNRSGIFKSLGEGAYALTHGHPEQFLQSLKTLGSAAYQQRRADQGNSLLSQQGPEKVTAIIDAILARNQLITSGQPYVLNPTLRAAGPYIGTVPGQGQLPWDSPPQRPGQRRSQAPTTRVIDASKPSTFRIP